MSIKNLILLLLVALVLTQVLSAQRISSRKQVKDTADVDPYKMSLVGASFVGGCAALHFGRYTPLWNDYKTEFFVKEDYKYAYNQDKIMHVYAGLLGTRTADQAFKWVGWDRTTSIWLAGISTTTFLFFQEFEDGHISYLGFDRTDLLGDVVGAAYPIAQHYLPTLRAFTPKLSYHTSGNPTTAKGQLSIPFLTDHEGQTLWVGITVYDLLPRSARQYWIPWLGLAFGRSVKNIQQPELAYAEYYIAFDIDLRKIDTGSDFLNTVLDFSNYIHLPLPAVRFSPSTTVFGFYF
jgi:hypothetical protein